MIWPDSKLVKAHSELCKRWGLSREQSNVLLGHEENKSHPVAETQDILDRVGYAFNISIGLGCLFDENLETELRWLNTPEETLQSKTPMSVMLNGKMADLMAVSRVVDEMRNL